MRSSPADFHGIRQHGRFPTRLDGGGSTLMSEVSLWSTAVSSNTLPVISPSRTGFTPSVSFRDRNAKSGLDLVEAWSLIENAFHSNLKPHLRLHFNLLFSQSFLDPPDSTALLSSFLLFSSLRSAWFPECSHLMK